MPIPMNPKHLSAAQAADEAACAALADAPPLVDDKHAPVRDTRPVVVDASAAQDTVGGRQ